MKGLSVNHNWVGVTHGVAISANGRVNPAAKSHVHGVPVEMTLRGWYFRVYTRYRVRQDPV